MRNQIRTIAGCAALTLFCLPFSACGSTAFFQQQHPGLIGDTGTVTALGTAVAEQMGGDATLGAMSAHFIAVLWNGLMNGAPAATQQSVVSSATVTAPPDLKLQPPAASATVGTTK